MDWCTLVDFYLAEYCLMDDLLLLFIYFYPGPTSSQVDIYLPDV